MQNQQCQLRASDSNGQIQIVLCKVQTRSHRLLPSAFVEMTTRNTDDKSPRSFCVQNECVNCKVCVPTVSASSPSTRTTRTRCGRLTGGGVSDKRERLINTRDWKLFRTRARVAVPDQVVGWHRAAGGSATKSSFPSATSTSGPRSRRNWRAHAHQQVMVTILRPTQEKKVTTNNEFSVNTAAR